MNKRYKHVSVCNTFSQECGVLKDIKKSLLLSAVFRSETAQSGAKPQYLSKYRLKWNTIFFHIILPEPERACKRLSYVVNYGKSYSRFSSISDIDIYIG